ncbi:MAG: hypothetical protein QOF53_3040 [Nocardioidaceae bacterium]|nr:hypothetical protein [Nocardioidaceae bacterium]
MSNRLDVLLAGLASEDPSVRDGWAYEELAAGIDQGRFAGDIDLIRATAVTRLLSDQVQVRTFAPLILTWLVHSGDRDRDAFDAVASWYLSETDTRGYDVHLGWLHAVAHGADYLGACAAAGIARGPEVLEILVRRMLAGGAVWQDMENARVAAAAALALARCDREESTAWLAPIDDALRTLEEAASANPESDRPPAWLHNLFAACCTLYVALAEQPRDGETALEVPHADHARAGMAQVLGDMAPWLLAARDA